ncbi:MAG TPA: tetratricopeptide repeat protein [Candidatus Limnocylindrales bacterium]
MPGGPELTDDISASELDAAVRAELLPLARPVAEVVSRHLVAAGKLLDDEPTRALEHAMVARRLASRIAAVREAVGLAAYHAGEWATAIAELRTYHRMTGRQTHLAVLADCERALGRPEKAIDLFRTADRAKLGRDEALELLIVAAGARGDMGQHDAAATMLQIRELSIDSEEPWAARLRYAYADALLEAGRTEEAREWFGRAAEVDVDSTTDAAERLLEMDGITIEDEEDEEDEEDAKSDVDEEDVDQEDVDEDEGEDEEEDEDEEGEEGDEGDGGQEKAKPE